MTENIVELYLGVINEYLQHMMQSEYLRTADNTYYVVCIGLNAIIHIFKTLLIKTNNLQNTYLCCQKGIYCYLEYIEQMNNTSTLHNLNNLDAIVFIYKKALDDIYNAQTISFQEITPNAENIVAGDKSISHFLNVMSILTKTIVFYKTEITMRYKSGNNEESIVVSQQYLPQTENVLQQMLQLTNMYLSKFIYLMGFTWKQDNPNTVDYDFIPMIQYMQNTNDKLNLSYHHYLLYLEEVSKYIKKLKKTNRLPTITTMDNQYLELFFNHENIDKLDKYQKTNKYNLIAQQLFLFSNST